MGRVIGLVLTAVLLVSVVACKGSADSPTSQNGSESACDPLASKPITLGAIVGVGQSADGTLYVDSANGVFVSADGQLIRQHVAGTGSSGEDELLFTFEAPGADLSSAQNLLVETQSGKATAMALGPDNSKAFLDQAPAGVTALTVVDPAMVSGMPVVNTPNVLDYIGDVANGDVLMATLPMNDTDPQPDNNPAGIAIFYGPPSALAQRTVTDFGQSLSGNGSLTFVVDGTPYVLAFGQEPTADAGPFGVFMLEGLTPHGGASMAVTVRSPTPSAVPTDLAFSCLP
jgi:hypothetical protein